MSTLHHGDCLEVMAAMDAGSIDAIVTDPPYGLEFMGVGWDTLRDNGKGRVRSSADVLHSQEHPRHPEEVGYIRGKKNRAAQDFHTAWATAALRLLKPSHYLLAFGGTRTWHRLACAIEDAGFEIRDTLMWLYGSGFPKGKACLKPAWEPVILARKPGPKRELGIEECRVASLDAFRVGNTERSNSVGYGAETWQKSGTTPPSGRWPANLILDEESAAMLDGQTGMTGAHGGHGQFKQHAWMLGPSPQDIAPDSGGASRFFYIAKASRAERNAGCEGEWSLFRQEDGLRAEPTQQYGSIRQERGAGYEADSRHQNHHPTVKPVALMRWLVKLVACPGDLVLDPFMGSGTTGVACAMDGREFIGIEKDAEYTEIARRRIAHAEGQMRLPV